MTSIDPCNIRIVSATGRSADPRGFYSYQNPQLYLADWKGYYDSALEGREAVQERFPHAADLKYGDDPHQMVSVYYPATVTAAPVVVYFHGGRWREGHPAFYDQLAAPWV
jgi:arylformamidase